MVFYKLDIVHMLDNVSISYVVVNLISCCRHVHILHTVWGPASEACVYQRLQQTISFNISQIVAGTDEASLLARNLTTNKCPQQIKTHPDSHRPMVTLLSY